jgi:amidase
MARSLSTLVTVMQHIINSRPWILDSNVVPIEWRHNVFEEIQSRPLTIGILIDDGIVKVHPPIERALRDLEAQLKAAGHEIVPWDCEGHKECIEIMVWNFCTPSERAIAKYVTGSLLHRGRRRGHTA